MKNNVLRYVSLVLLIAWMCVIFKFSAQSATVSDDVSDGLIEKVVSSIYPDYDLLDEQARQQVIERFSGPVRTAAHFSEFAVLGGLMFIFVWTFKKISVHLRLVITLAGGFVYAVSDEVHQLFSEDRAFQIFDIMVDFCGVLLAATLCYLIALRMLCLRGGKNEQ